MKIHYQTTFLISKCGKSFCDICKDFESLTSDKENVTCIDCLKSIEESKNKIIVIDEISPSYFLNKTVIFEKKYNVNINDFDTTKDVDNFIESKIGRKLEIIGGIV